MSARLLATLCLVFGSVPASSAPSAASADATLVVYLKGGNNQPAAPLAEMKREVSVLMGQAGYSVEWRSVGAQTGEESNAEMLAVLELSGNCGLAPGYGAAEAPAVATKSLATTSISDGQVLPFSQLNCTALTRSVSSSLAQTARAQRDFLYGRAMARVVAHELYHVLTRSTEHARAGVARSCFTPADLLTERFEFEGATVARLRTRIEPVAAEVTSFGEEAAVRQ
ncbi:MAG: hypothetical protein ABI759_32115 [Candidatus Solibacter sp.]